METEKINPLTQDQMPKSKECRHEEVFPEMRANKIFVKDKEQFLIGVHMICSQCKKLLRSYDKKAIGLMAVNTYILELQDANGVFDQPDS